MGARRIITPSGRGVRGRFPSRKMGKMVEWESLLERDAIYLFEFSPAVVAYRSQPEKFYFHMDGETHLYYPDFDVELDTGEVMHAEIKPKARLAKKDIRRRFDFIEKQYQRTNRRFLILTEQEIRKDPLLKNLSLLAYHLRETSDHIELTERYELLKLLPACTIAGANAVLGDPIHTLHLLAAGLIQCDLTLPITPETHISFSTKEVGHAPLLF